MRLYVAAGRLNTSGVCTTIYSESDCMESIDIVDSYDLTAQEACIESAKVLRAAADKFDELAKEPDDKVLKRKTHVRLNGFNPW